MLDINSVKSQRLIISDNRCHCQVTLNNGKTLDLEKAIPDFKLEPDINISKTKFLTRLNEKL